MPVGDMSGSPWYTVSTAPPLISSTAEIDILVEKLGQALDQTAAHYGIA